MATQRDYYDTLGVHRDATEEEIRKAFRRKALEFHPDRNKDPQAADRFKEVNEAYQVLTNPQRRTQYDQFGRSESGAQNIGFDTGDLLGGFGSIFDAFFGDGATTTTRTRVRPGADIQAELRISFSEAAFGAAKEVTLDRQEACQRCGGSCTEPGHLTSTCANCRGSGQVRRTHRSIFGQFVQQGTCNVCGGNGDVVSHPCTQCRGSGKEHNERRIRVDVPAGVEGGMRLQLRGEGDLGGHGATPGDLYILVQVEPHLLFRRSEFDVLYDLELTFPQVALGDEVQVPTLEDEVRLKVPPGTQTGTVFRLKGKGIPHLGRDSRRGDELVTVHIATPDRLTKYQRELLEKLRLSFGQDGQR
jgi:molecular chaperone DnaJ